MEGCRGRWSVEGCGGLWRQACVAAGHTCSDGAGLVLEDCAGGITLVVVEIRVLVGMLCTGAEKSAGNRLVLSGIGVGLRALGRTEGEVACTAAPQPPETRKSCALSMSYTIPFRFCALLSLSGFCLLGFEAGNVP